MNIQEKHLTEQSLRDVKSFDLDGLIEKNYTSRNIKQDLVENFAPLEMIQLLKQAVKQLDDSLVVYWKFLPVTTNEINSSVPIYVHIQKIAESIDLGGKFNSWVNQLVSLIRYEIQNGIWINTSLKQLEQDHNSLYEKLKKNIDESGIFLSNIRGHFNEIQGIHSLVKDGQRSLSSSNDEAAQTVLELKQLQRDLDKASGETNALLSQLNMRTVAADTAFENERDRFNQLLTEIHVLQQEFGKSSQLLETKSSEFDTTLKNAQEKEKHILDQKSEIDKIRGFSADISLGSAFDKRQAQLRLPVLVWGIASLIMVGAAAKWITLVFQTYGSQSADGVNWLILLANVVRTSPAFVLVYFCLAQYTRERNLQEEYAFKSAVSMTITAYSEMISEVPERIKMLMAAVQGVYTPPASGKPFTPFSFRTKDVAEISKNLLDATKNVQKIGVDKLKSSKKEKEDKDDE